MAVLQRRVVLLLQVVKSHASAEELVFLLALRLDGRFDRHFSPNAQQSSGGNAKDP